VTGVFANDAHDAATPDDLALVTDFLHAGADFHFSSRKPSDLLNDLTSVGVDFRNADEHAITLDETDYGVASHRIETGADGATIL
jgi:hypothetical protein